eukprot:CAMPEP_0185041872 /NCGR_PEP_ID=MMETSP1103-20130426/41714_1 /TAXON_ID=36769 /ORGANISM="Paraphysomonas bandaiensis, Strain Caron Lab Isolate" /LENGTH=151 /DNA_ID=CAMNT_0027581799 /DNA_START=386 /DNA_END=841 /DNA_ORIENTATION=+
MAGTKISLRDYVMSMIGILPGTITYVFIGTSAGSVLGFGDDDEDDGALSGGTEDTIQLVALVLGIVLALVATVVISVHARRYLMNLVRDAGAERDTVGILASPMHMETEITSETSSKTGRCSGLSAERNSQTPLSARGSSTLHEDIENFAV